MIREVLWNWLPWLYNKTTDILYTSNRVFNAAYTELTVTKELLFLKNINLPVMSQIFTDIPIESIRWRCELNPMHFIDPLYKDMPFKHISYLGFTINIPGYDPIDLSDSINDIKWKGLVEPTPHDIFVAWCYEKCASYIHSVPLATVDLITETGDTIFKGLNEFIHTNSSVDVASI